MSDVESEDDELDKRALIDQALALHDGTYKTEMDKAIECISIEMKAEYMEALHACPTVASIESDPLMFLRREKFNYWAASLRLASYWKLRKEVFREDAFLPLLGSSHSTGANVFNVLPPDEKGRSVLCFDARSMDEASANLDFFRRMSFCFGSLLARNVRNQVEGFTFVCLFSRKLPEISHSCRVVLDIIVKALPVRVARILLVQASVTEWTRSDFLREVVPGVLNFVGNAFERLTVPVAGDTLDEVKIALISSGVQTELVDQLLSSEFWSRPNGCPKDDLTVPEVGNAAWSPPTCTPKSPSLGQVSLQPCDYELSGLAQMEESLRSLPHCEKIAFLEAVQTAPCLVDTETPRLRFLRFERHDPQAAARRLVTYWQMRKDVFSERFCLPLSIAQGPSALSDFDLSVLGSGFGAYVSCDQKGRAIVLFNPSRADFVGDHDRYQRIRILFYVVHVASEHSTEAVTLTVFSVRGASPRSVQFYLEFMEKGAPIQLVHSNVCILSPKSGWRSYMQACVPRLMQGLPKYVLRNLTLHIACTRKDILGRLEAAGFLVHHLPDCLGGTWTCEDSFASWLQGRTQVDAIRYSHEPKCTVSVKNTNCLIMEALHARSRPDQLGFLGLESADGAKHNSVPFEIRPHDFRVNFGLQGRGNVAAARSESPPSHLHPSSSHENEKEDSSINRSREDDQPALSFYQRALLYAPEIVAKESSMDLFLRFTRNDDRSLASERLERYWMAREAAFGKRSYLPMNQTGEGALTQNDCKLLAEGFIVPLQCDIARRSVICINFSKLSTSDLQVTSLQRIVFYMGSVLCENPVTQSDGCVVLLLLCQTQPHPGALLDELLRTLLGSLPIHAHSAHLFGAPAYCDRQLFTLLAAEAISVLDGHSAPRCTSHYFDSASSIACHLESHGLKASALPKSFGGTWSYSCLSDWIDTRIRFEWSLPTRKEMHHGAAPVPHLKVAPLSQCSQEEKQERTRRLHMLHSRRRRGRMRVEVDVLEAQVDELVQQNKRLREENSILEVELLSAKQMIATCAPGECNV